jgi:SAM-dependent methyltransferase
MTAFDPRSYWEQRLSEHYTLDGVGYLGLGEGFNRWMYRVRRHVFLREARRLFSDPRELRVLDVGSGTGFYLDRWHELGVASVTGSDLTQVAVVNLQQRNPLDAIAAFDVGGDDHPFGSTRFAAVSMMDVLFHVVDDQRFRRAFTSVFELLEPGGVLIFSENFLHGDAIRLPHQASRSLREIDQSLADAGFDVLRRRPVFCLMNAPLDSDSRLLWRWWSGLHRVASRRHRLGAAIGALLYPLELVFVSRLGEGPSTELMICRRPAAR